MLENVLYARSYTSEHQYELLDYVAAKFHEEAGVFKLLVCCKVTIYCIQVLKIYSSCIRVFWYPMCVCVCERMPVFKCLFPVWEKEIVLHVIFLFSSLTMLDIFRGVMNSIFM